MEKFLKEQVSTDYIKEISTGTRKWQFMFLKIIPYKAD